MVGDGVQRFGQKGDFGLSRCTSDDVRRQRGTRDDARRNNNPCWRQVWGARRNRGGAGAGIWLQDDIGNAHRSAARRRMRSRKRSSQLGEEKPKGVRVGENGRVENDGVKRPKSNPLRASLLQPPSSNILLIHLKQQHDSTTVSQRTKYQPANEGTRANAPLEHHHHVCMHSTHAIQDFHRIHPSDPHNITSFHFTI